MAFYTSPKIAADELALSDSEIAAGIRRELERVKLSARSLDGLRRHAKTGDLEKTAADLANVIDHLAAAADLLAKNTDGSILT